MKTDVQRLEIIVLSLNRFLSLEDQAPSWITFIFTRMSSSKNSLKRHYSKNFTTMNLYEETQQKRPLFPTVVQTWSLLWVSIELLKDHPWAGLTVCRSSGVAGRWTLNLLDVSGLIPGLVVSVSLHTDHCQSHTEEWRKSHSLQVWTLQMGFVDPPVAAAAHSSTAVFPVVFPGVSAVKFIHPFIF